MDVINVRDYFEIVDGVLYRKEFARENGKTWPRRAVGITKSNHSGGYVTVGVNDRKIFVHRIIWEYYNGPIPAGLLIDHINGIKHDNRIENLRLATSRENQQNRIKHREGKLFGCRYHRHSRKWQAQAWVDGKTRHIGYFNTEQEAHEAYKNFFKERDDNNDKSCPK
jgi:hypothetical protein